MNETYFKVNEAAEDDEFEIIASDESDRFHDCDDSMHSEEKLEEEFHDTMTEI